MTDKQKRGLAAMSPEKRKMIQRMGGLASPTNFKNNIELAKRMSKKAALARKASNDQL